MKKPVAGLEKMGEKPVAGATGRTASFSHKKR